MGDAEGGLAVRPDGEDTSTVTTPPEGRLALVLPPADDEALPAGAPLGRLYRVVRPLGGGGMGAVYEVEHVRLGKRFAAKVLRRAIAADAGAVARFEREAIAASRVRHPNLVEVVNFDVAEDGRAFLVQELLEGASLRAVLGERPLSAAELCGVGLAIASGLHAAHEAGIVHRDLKPSNVFLRRSEGGVDLKILDFGVSKLAGDGAESLTQSGFVVGTPTYMAPEIAEGGRPSDRRVDVYALGVLLYEAWVGQAPFRGEAPLAILYQHVHRAAPPPGERRPGLPAGLEAVVLGCLAKRPEARPSTMAEVAERLASAAATHGLTPVLPGAGGAEPAPGGRPARPRRTARWVLAAAAAATLAWAAAERTRPAPASPVAEAPAPPQPVVEAAAPPARPAEAPGPAPPAKPREAEPTPRRPARPRASPAPARASSASPRMIETR